MVRTYAGAADDAELPRQQCGLSWHPEQGGWMTRISKSVRVNAWFDQRVIRGVRHRLPGFAGLPLDEGALR